MVDDKLALNVVGLNLATGDGIAPAATSDTTIHAGAGSGKRKKHPRLKSLGFSNRTGNPVTVQIFDGPSADAILLDEFIVAASASGTRQDGEDFDNVIATTSMVLVQGSADDVIYFPKFTEE